MKKFTLDLDDLPELTEEQEKQLDANHHEPCDDAPELDRNFFKKAKAHNVKGKL